MPTPFLIGELNRGKSLSEEIKLKISESRKGYTPWNKGKEYSEETRKKISLAKKGQVPWNKGIKWTKEQREKASKIAKERYQKALAKATLKN